MHVYNVVIYNLLITKNKVLNKNCMLSHDVLNLKNDKIMANIIPFF